VAPVSVLLLRPDGPPSGCHVLDAPASLLLVFAPPRRERRDPGELVGKSAAATDNRFFGRRRRGYLVGATVGLSDRALPLFCTAGRASRGTLEGGKGDLAVVGAVGDGGLADGWAGRVRLGRSHLAAAAAAWDAGAGRRPGLQAIGRSATWADDAESFGHGEPSYSLAGIVAEAEGESRAMKEYGPQLQETAPCLTLQRYFHGGRRSQVVLSTRDEPQERVILSAAGRRPAADRRKSRGRGRQENRSWSPRLGAILLILSAGVH
jgi:hypothetical protein